MNPTMNLWYITCNWLIVTHNGALFPVLYFPSFTSQLYFSYFQWVGREGEGKLCQTQWTAFRAIHRNVGGSNLIGLFTSSI